MAKLTKGLVDRAEADAGQVFLWDDQMRGFGVLVLPSGRRSFIVQYRTLDGRQRRRVIGTYPVMTVDEARRRARIWLVNVQHGEDPAESIDNRRHAAAVADLCRRYLDQHAELHLKPKSVLEDRRLIERLILPALGSRKAASVSHDDIDQLHKHLKATPYQANRVIGLLSTIFNQFELSPGPPRLDQPLPQSQALQGGKAPALSVAGGVRPPGRGPGGDRGRGHGAAPGDRRDPTVDLHRLPLLGNPEPHLGRSGYRRPQAGAPGQQDRRQGRAPGAAGDRGPARAAETGRQPACHSRPAAGRGHDRSQGRLDRIRAYDLNTRLGARIEALCRELLPGGEPDGATWRCKALKGGVGDRVRVKLAGDRPGAWHDASTNQAGRPIELVKAARGLRSRSAAVAWAKDWLGDSESGGLVDVRLHDLRHSFASVGAGAGLSLPIIGALLGHSQPATTARYAHLASDPLQEAVNLVGRRLADALGGKGRDGGEVLKLSNKAKR